MMKLRSMKFCRSNSKAGKRDTGIFKGGKIEWELRPGGMLVQIRDHGIIGGREGMIKVRVSMGSRWHDISIGSTSTFGELKMVLSLVTGLEPWEQRLLFRGKEREDEDHLHMAGVENLDKVVLMEDPAAKDRKIRRATAENPVPYSTIMV